MLTILEVIQKTADFFTAKGIESARLNAETVVGHALGLKRMQLYLQFERPLKDEELDKIRPLVKRRGQREPLQHILGNVEWAGLVLKCDRRALIPRPETEYLVELIQGRITVPPASILDLGTGSGALACAMASIYPDATVTAVDLSEDAISLARENVTALGLESRVQVLRSDWFGALPADARYDLIVANPPYLTAEETAESEPEVRQFEPVSALTANEQGLADLRAILQGAGGRLRAGGLIALETGIAQHEALLDLVTKAGLLAGESVGDLTGRDRFVFARAAGG